MTAFDTLKVTVNCISSSYPEIDYTHELTKLECSSTKTSKSTISLKCDPLLYYTGSKKVTLQHVDCLDEGSEA